MRAREFVDRLNQVKATARADGAAPELAAGLHEITEHLRRTWSPEQLKAALASDQEVPTDLEEAMTTLTMLWMQHRGRH